MKRILSAIAVYLFFFPSIAMYVGCAGETTITPQQKEEKRQQMIKNAERERQEG